MTEMARTIEESIDSTTEAEIEALATMPIAQLRQRYRQLFRVDPPKAFGPDLLRRSISWRLQERAYGGLPRTTQRLLREAIKAMAVKPDSRIVLPRRPGPGAILERAWNGRRYRVMVLADGFAYDGKTFASLSEIASLITGTHWNGPRFFGLREKKSQTTTDREGQRTATAPPRITTANSRSITSRAPSPSSAQPSDRNARVRGRAAGAVHHGG